MVWNIYSHTHASREVIHFLSKSHKYQFAGHTCMTTTKGTFKNIIVKWHYCEFNCDVDLKRQMRKYYMNANLLLRKFSYDVNCMLFKTCCSRHIVLYTVVHCGLIALKLQWNDWKYHTTTVYADWQEFRNMLVLVKCL